LVSFIAEQGHRPGREPLHHRHSWNCSFRRVWSRFLRGLRDYAEDYEDYGTTLKTTRTTRTTTTRITIGTTLKTT